MGVLHGGLCAADPDPGRGPVALRAHDDLPHPHPRPGSGRSVERRVDARQSFPLAIRRGTGSRTSSSADAASGPRSQASVDVRWEHPAPHDDIVTKLRLTKSAETTGGRGGVRITVRRR